MAKSAIDSYADNQRAQYDAQSVSRSDAERTVGPDYTKLRAASPQYRDMVITTHFRDKIIRGKNWKDEIPSLSVLDFGCGVGRVMEAFAEIGVARIDGADISSTMLGHARASKTLQKAKSNFYLTSGHDIGNAPRRATTSPTPSCASITSRCVRRALI